MDYKSEIEAAVTKIEVATGKSRGDIAEELGYTPTYISTAISRGGNKKLLDKIKEKYSNVFAESKSISEPDLTDQALLKALLTDYIKLKAQITKRSVTEVADELEENTMLILRELKK